MASLIHFSRFYYLSTWKNKKVGLKITTLGPECEIAQALNNK